ncbi:enoyl-CoA hydratase-related protein [Streptomyces sp. NPDC057376]|uniref:enoyl-CoA hydratase-related protein n=1 Tax=Streptomyces sp. NPDC057376 TaxID=3346110 RepID=UPI00363205B2
MSSQRQVLTADSDELQAELESGVLLLRLNRPRARNALTLEMLEALASRLAWAQTEPAVRVVVLTGAGAGFCAGGDIKVMAAGRSIYGTSEEPELRTRRQIEVQRATSVALWHFGKPTVALINGPAVGAGLALALACDLRYAAASSTLGSGFAAVGLAGDFGCTWLLNRLLGPARAKEMLLFAQSLGARRSLDWGLVNGVFDDDRLLTEGLARARRLADGPQTALGAIKEHIARAGREDLATCADAEVRRHVQLMAGEEHRAAVRRLLGGISSAESQVRTGR